MSSSTSAASSSELMDVKKIFLGGLRYSETEDSVAMHFQQFGAVQGVLIPRDRLTGKARGFGFVVFKDEAVAQRIVQDKTMHFFHGRVLDIKLAVPKPDAEEEGEPETEPDLARSMAQLAINVNPAIPTGANPGISMPLKINQTVHEHENEQENEELEEQLKGFVRNRVFVGGLPEGATNAVLREYFSQFGTVIDSFVLLHAITRRPRGFGFVTFKEEEVVPQVLSFMHHCILGKPVETRLATTRADKKEPAVMSFMNNNMMGMSMNNINIGQPFSMSNISTPQAQYASYQPVSLQQHQDYNDFSYSGLPTPKGYFPTPRSMNSASTNLLESPANGQYFATNNAATNGYYSNININPSGAGMSYPSASATNTSPPAAHFTFSQFTTAPGPYMYGYQQQPGNNRN